MEKLKTAFEEHITVKKKSKKGGNEEITKISKVYFDQVVDFVYNYYLNPILDAFFVLVLNIKMLAMTQNKDKVSFLLLEF